MADDIVIDWLTNQTQERKYQKTQQPNWFSDNTKHLVLLLAKFYEAWDTCKHVTLPAVIIGPPNNSCSRARTLI